VNFETTHDLGLELGLCLDLETAAAGPYHEFVYGSLEAGRRVVEALHEAGASDLAYGQLVLADGRPAGLLSWTTGEVLRRLRVKAAMVLGRTERFRSDPSIAARARLAATTLATLEADDAYVGRVAVAPGFRDTGVGVWIMGRLLEEAKAAGAPRLVAEISPENPAIQRILCGHHGFEHVEQRRVEDPETGRVLAYDHVVHVVGS